MIYIHQLGRKCITANQHVHALKYWRSRYAPSGWQFIRIEDSVHRHRRYLRCSRSRRNWWGWCGGRCSGTIRTTLRKCGKAILKFGNCSNAGYVVAKLNGRQVGRANPYQSKTIVFAFKDGDILELTDIGISIIEFDDLNIISCSTCLGK